MSSNCDKVIAALRYLEINPDVGEYFGRFLTQKTTFIAQTLGLPTSYCFTPYLNGPYSSPLAHDYYNFKDKFMALRTDYQIDENLDMGLAKLKRCNDLFEIANFYLMESTSTIIYYLTRLTVHGDQAVLDLVKLIKPHLTEDALFLGMARAKEILFKPEYMTPAFKREIEDWNNIPVNFQLRR